MSEGVPLKSSSMCAILLPATLAIYTTYAFLRGCTWQMFDLKKKKLMNKSCVPALTFKELGCRKQKSPKKERRLFSFFPQKMDSTPRLGIDYFKTINFTPSLFPFTHFEPVIMRTSKETTTLWWKRVWARWKRERSRLRGPSTPTEAYRARLKWRQTKGATDETMVLHSLVKKFYKKNSKN